MEPSVLGPGEHGFYCSLPPCPCVHAHPKLPFPEFPPFSSGHPSCNHLPLILRFAENLQCQDLILATELEDLQSQSFHPLATKNVCTNFNPSNGWGDISLKKQKPACGSRGKNQGIMRVVRIHPLRSTNVFRSFRGNPSDRCWYISVGTRAVDRPSDTEKCCEHG